MEKWARNVRGSVIVKWETNKEKNSSKEGESVGIGWWCNCWCGSTEM